MLNRFLDSSIPGLLITAAFVGLFGYVLVAMACGQSAATILAMGWQ